MAKKEISEVLKTTASKQYRQLLAEADKTVSKYAAIISRATEKDPDEISAEIQAIYLDNLRKADDPVSLMKENLVNLMLKKQTSDYLKEHLHKKALADAEAAGDSEKIKNIEAEMMNELLISDFDLKFHKAIQESIKTVNQSEKRIPLRNPQMYDDNIALDIPFKENE